MAVSGFVVGNPGVGGFVSVGVDIFLTLKLSTKYQKGWTITLNFLLPLFQLEVLMICFVLL